MTPTLDVSAPSSYQRCDSLGHRIMVKNDDSFEFAEVKAQDIMAEREGLWAAFTNATKWSIIAVVVILVLLYLVFG